ncbi:BnaA02g09740D [Brassica napus]|uniref:BnaA02g09740D protein n=1 Tax=Brassica napus TaxID=3708 RepID=A0A078GUM2_BRANA|nr:BnaA02g09740D [Brassica napus]
MLAFLADAHRSRKTGDILDKKVKRIVETVKEKINDQLTQGNPCH